MQALRWDVFCRVIDNHGDLGVCWRLARELATRGQTVRLWVDDPTALGWMAPSGADRVEVQHWTRATTPPSTRRRGDRSLRLRPARRPLCRAMAAARPAPLWINLEYLSAEAYVERCHGLPSPQQAGPGRGLLKWFFYPGFDPGTGGLLREADLASRRLAFDATGWLGTLGIEPRAGERRVSVFCYDDAARPELLEGLAAAPTLLLLTPGSPRQTLQALVCAQGRRSHVRCVELPWLSQPDYDHLLWACDLNIVRGEDSLVRALWAGAPFVWQIYPAARRRACAQARRLPRSVPGRCRCAGRAAPAVAVIERPGAGAVGLARCPQLATPCRPTAPAARLTRRPGDPAASIRR